MTVYDHIADAASYTSRRYRTNHHRHWWGIAHRARLIDSGEYVKTSEQTRYVFKWPHPRQPTLRSINEAIFDMITAMNLSQRISAPVMADDIRALRARQMFQSPRSPDCRDGNCRKCDGQAWDETTDALASCGCTCHLEPTH